MAHTIKILLADDDPVLRRLLPSQINASDIEFVTAEDAKSLLAYFRDDDFDIVLLDVNLPDASGIELLSTIRRGENPPEVIMLTADASLETGIEAMRRGAYDYVTKPANPQQVEALIRKAFEKRRLVKENELFRLAVRRQNEDLTIEPVHQSSLMNMIYSQAETVARLDTTILITGESGTGKDVLARWIHSRSSRADLPLIVVNCGALPEHLFESEFFGHEKGSFTGATVAKTGLVEAADGSTLFLDEIGEMPIQIQVKLLQFLENGTFRAVGATRDKRASVRVIAATNKDLAAEVRAGNFRMDLFYRLNVVSFNLPPLRDRPEDLPALAAHFADKLRLRFNRPKLGFSDRARQQISEHSWPGNIRELRNTLERSAALSRDDIIDEIHLNRDSGLIDKAVVTGRSEAPKSLAEIEREHIQRVLEITNGHREKAAVVLGITARTLYRKIAEYDSQN